MVEEHLGNLSIVRLPGSQAEADRMTSRVNDNLDLGC